MVISSVPARPSSPSLPESGTIITEATPFVLFGPGGVTRFRPDEGGTEKSR